MSPLVNDLLPEWAPFRDAVERRDPAAGTACSTWTTRDVVLHQLGNAVELARVLDAHLAGDPVPATRGFAEREAAHRALDDQARLAALERAVGELAAIAERGLGRPDEWVPWTSRRMRVAWFAEHLRSELVLHRWDLVGDDDVGDRALGAPWMTAHTVDAVGVPLLRAGLRVLGDTAVRARLRAPGQDDVVVRGGAEPGIALEAPTGDPDLVSDPAARTLLLWGRTPSDPSRWRSDTGPQRLAAVRTLLSGY